MQGALRKLDAAQVVLVLLVWPVSAQGVLELEPAPLPSPLPPSLALHACCTPMLVHRNPQGISYALSFTQSHTTCMLSYNTHMVLHSRVEQRQACLLPQYPAAASSQSTLGCQFLSGHAPASCPDVHSPPSPPPPHKYSRNNMPTPHNSSEDPPDTKTLESQYTHVVLHRRLEQRQTCLCHNILQPLPPLDNECQPVSLCQHR